MTKTQKCPSCGRRIFDIIRDSTGEIEMKCPHCHKVIKIKLK